MNRYIFFLFLVVGASSWAEQSIIQNNRSLFSALRSAKTKCSSAEIQTLIFDNMEITDALSREEVLDESILKSLLSSQADVHRAIARAKDAQTPECIHALENIRSALALYITSKPLSVSDPKSDYDLTPVKRLRVPKTPASGSKDAYGMIKSIIEKSVRYARTEEIGKGRKIYRFDTKSENSTTVDTDCQIVFTVDESKNTIDVDWEMPKWNRWGGHWGGSVTFSSEPSDNYKISGQHLVMVSRSQSDQKVYMETHIIPSSDGSLDRFIMASKGSSSDLACSVVKFMTYDDPMPAPKGH